MPVFGICVSALEERFSDDTKEGAPFLLLTPKPQNNPAGGVQSDTESWLLTPCLPLCP